MGLQIDANSTANKTHAINTQLVCTAALSEQSAAARCASSFIYSIVPTAQATSQASLCFGPKRPHKCQQWHKSQVTTRASCPTIPTLFVFPLQYLFEGKKKKKSVFAGFTIHKALKTCRRKKKKNLRCYLRNSSLLNLSGLKFLP